jgi:hypothetical protein
MADPASYQLCLGAFQQSTALAVASVNASSTSIQACQRSVEVLTATEARLLALITQLEQKVAMYESGTGKHNPIQFRKLLELARLVDENGEYNDNGEGFSTELLKWIQGRGICNGTKTTPRILCQKEEELEVAKQKRAQTRKRKPDETPLNDESQENNEPFDNQER